MNNIKQNAKTLADLEPILPLDIADDGGKVKSPKIGTGFEKEDFKFNVEYYWCDKRQNMCRRIPNPTSYAEAAFCSTLVIGRIVPKKVEEVKTQPSFGGYKEEKPNYGFIYDKYSSNITSFDKGKNALSKTHNVLHYSKRRKHKTSKRNKVVKHFKQLDEFDYLDSRLESDMEQDWSDYYDDYYADYYADYYDDYYDDYYYSTCRGPYSGNFSRCFGLCCN